MSKSASIQELEKQYTHTKALCDSFSIEVTRQITKLLEDNNIQLAVPIQYRTKSWDSIRNKCEQGRFTIKKSLSELQDLIGIRLILLFKRDLAKVTDLIENHFSVIKKYNTEDRLEENQFGYMSIHEIVKLKDEWLKVPTLSALKELKCEIQIRTLVQHAWSEASHIFQYKNENDVPRPLKRTIGRLSALLETVDLEFERVLTEREEYKGGLTNNSPTETDNESLNVDLLMEILKNYFPEINDGSNDTFEYSNLLNELNVVNINTVDQLITLINRHKPTLMTQQKKLAEELLRNYEQTGKLADNKGGLYVLGKDTLEDLKSGYYYSRIGLVRQIISSETGKSLNEIRNTINKSL